MIKPYHADKWVTQYCSDALGVLREFESESIDLLATDPPYGIGFMGKDWDRALPDKEIWIECLRVLKPGAFAFVMSIPRSDCLSRMVISLEDAGFNVGFSPMYWTYASGFPKAQNIGKAVDKRGGAYFGQELCNIIKKRRLVLNLSTIQLAELGHFYGKVNHGGTVSNWEEGKGMPTLNQYNNLIDILGLEGNPLVEAEREIVSIKGSGKKRENTSFSDGLPIREIVDIPTTPQAKALDGSYGGFQPKPAVEVIIVAMKPLSGKTFVDQALKNRKGITWLDDCRIPYESEGTVASNPKMRVESGCKTETGDRVFCQGKLGKKNTMVENVLTGGRFPANLLVSDDVLNDGRVIKATNRPNSNGKIYKTKTYGNGRCNMGSAPVDSGSFSRYFDLDKWAQKTFPFLIVPKASKSEKNKGLDMQRVVASGLPLRDGPGDYVKNEYGDGSMSSRNTQTKNHHPTVKPLKLMSYLITLGSREGDTILDPFMGSGTTTLASKLLNRKCIGIEIEEKYCEIAAKRCSQDVMELKI